MENKNKIKIINNLKKQIFWAKSEKEKSRSSASRQSYFAGYWKAIQYAIDLIEKTD